MAPSAIIGNHANGDTNGSSVSPKIKLYTNHHCPYAHRAHIAIQELGLPYEETIIDLNVPRPQWYLDINPRGLVPTIQYSIPNKLPEQTIYESAIVAQFLCDSYPSHLLPSSTENPLLRARMNFFIDAWSTKCTSQMIEIVRTTDVAEKQATSDAWFEAFKKEIEPLLQDCAPFFGGSERLTFVEVICAPQLLRTLDLAHDGELIPSSLIEKLGGLKGFSRWSKGIRDSESVNRIYDGQGFVDAFKTKVAKMAAGGK